ncbi:hypothetical protein F5Y05DRAFT_388233 [Hypoxylon sp. FL0543]|nr:hypothetical protein F5Y05DRAFT_388233 [Hypoxylon sp. FL0543]
MLTPARETLPPRLACVRLRYLRGVIRSTVSRSLLSPLFATVLAAAVLVLTTTATAATTVRRSGAHDGLVFGWRGMRYEVATVIVACRYLLAT